MVEILVIFWIYDLNINCFYKCIGSIIGMTMLGFLGFIALGFTVIGVIAGGVLVKNIYIFCILLFINWKGSNRW